MTSTPTERRPRDCIAVRTCICPERSFREGWYRRDCAKCRRIDALTTDPWLGRPPVRFPFVTTDTT